MADRLISFMALIFLVAFQAVSVHAAENLTDPTRPPTMIVAPEAAVGAGAEGIQASGLRSIIISKTRRAAIIDGETIELGKKHGDARLVEVNEGSVVLRGPQGRQVLTLFPDVSITKKTGGTGSASSANKTQSGKRKTKTDAQQEEK